LGDVVLLHPKVEIFSVIGHVFYLFTLSPPSFDSSFSSEKLLLHTTTAMSDTKRQRTQDGEKKVLPPFLFFSFFFPFVSFVFLFLFFSGFRTRSLPVNGSKRVQISAKDKKEEEDLERNIV